MEAVRVRADIPADLHKEVKTVGKNLRMSVAAIITASLRSYVKEFEEDQLTREQIKQSTKKHRHLKSISPITPFDEREDAPVQQASVEQHDRLSGLFDSHAARIAEVLDNPTLVENRYQEARAAIRQVAAIQYGGERGDKKLLDRLEGCISKISRARPATLATPTQPENLPSLTSRMSTLAEALIQQLQSNQQLPEQPIVSKISPRRVRERAAVIDEE